MKKKLASRKFWAAVAAFLLSLSTSIAGMSSNNPTIVIFGTICGVASAAIYAAAEAYVDGAYSVSDKKEGGSDAIGFYIEGSEEENDG